MPARHTPEPLLISGESKTARYLPVSLFVQVESNAAAAGCCASSFHSSKAGECGVDSAADNADGSAPRAAPPTVRCFRKSRRPVDIFTPVGLYVGLRQSSIPWAVGPCTLKPESIDANCTCRERYFTVARRPVVVGAGHPG